MAVSHVIAALIGALLVAAAVLGYWLYRHGPAMLRARRRRSGTHTRYPVVLAHGFLGFDTLGVGSQQHQYFRGIPERLTTLGAQVHLFRVGAMASIAVRAEELAKRIDALGVPKVNIVAHSMGGLDARYAIAKLGLGKKVASLTTIGTPHRGTPLADMGHSLLANGLRLTRIFAAIGLQLEGIGDLTTEQMTIFNDRIKDVRGVSYGSFVASIKGGVRNVNSLLWPTYLYLSKRHGDNDGVVTVGSQAWGEVLGQIDADHWAQIGWSPSRGRFDVLDFYSELLLELRARGF